MENKFDWVEDCYQAYKKHWIQSKKFRKAAWTGRDHEHCLFDGKRISNYNISDNEKQGYESTDGWTWFCTECFEKLMKSNHKLPLVKNTVEDIESALSQFKTVVISLENEQYIIKNADGKIAVVHNGKVSEYGDILQMEREQAFYGKPLREIIDDIFIGII